MKVLDAAAVAAALDGADLVGALRNVFRSGAAAPVRHHHTIDVPGEPDATLLLMPAWEPADKAAVSRFAGVKIVSVYPGNAARGLPSVSGAYLLNDGATGVPLAVMDGGALTLWRTAAASALAASYLARADASRMVMVGAGALAPYLVAAHRRVRPIRSVAVWNRSAAGAERLAARLRADGLEAEATADLETAVRAADLVSCATLSAEPLVHGKWLKRGAHLDLVGAFTPAMRESDDDAVRRAQIFVDTRAGAMAEAGDIMQPLRSGAITEADVAGDLFDLCRDAVAGRQDADGITLFKSVGTAIEDLAAAALVWRLV